jgi:hypothetical protein
MVKEAEELQVKVKKARLLTIDEFNEFEEKLPKLPTGAAWWLADCDDLNDEAAYAEDNYREDGFFTNKDYPNTYLRIALDIKGGKEGEQFIFCGIVFTVLSKTLAISNNVLGTVDYYDEEMLAYIYEDDVTCTATAVIDTFFPYDAFEN